MEWQGVRYLSLEHLGLKKAKIGLTWKTKYVVIFGKTMSQWPSFMVGDPEKM